MEKSDNTTSLNIHRRVQNSTTLSRKYIERPALKSKLVSDIRCVPKTNSIKQSSCTKTPSMPVSSSNVSIKTASRAVESPIAPATVHPLQASARKKMSEKNQEARILTAKELKDQAIKKALATTIENTSEEKTKKSQKKFIFGKRKFHFGFGRIVLASVCAAVAVFGIVYFMNLNTPDMSLRVTAIQTGIDAKYPNYVPRDFIGTDITSENGKIVLEFKNTDSDTVFTITEENSAWDSNALLNNFVKKSYSDSYTIVKEQGLTIYIDESSACWVNGGILYKIETTSGSLTKKQLTTIATSGWK